MTKMNRLRAMMLGISTPGVWAKHVWNSRKGVMR